MYELKDVGKPEPIPDDFGWKAGFILDSIWFDDLLFF